MSCIILYVGLPHNVAIWRYLLGKLREWSILRLHNWSCSLNFEYYAGALQSCVQNIISFILRHTPPSTSARQGNIFQGFSEQNCCFRISTETCARISGQGQPICWCLPSHSPTSTIPSSHKLNYISSHCFALPIALKELQGPRPGGLEDS